jgi:hypothetical protein
MLSPVQTNKGRRGVLQRSDYTAWWTEGCVWGAWFVSVGAFCVGRARGGPAQCCHLCGGTKGGVASGTTRPGGLWGASRGGGLCLWVRFVLGVQT